MSSGSGSGDRARRRSAPERLADLTGLGTARRRERLAFFELDERDAEALRGLRPLAEASVDELVAEFYAHLRRFPHLERLLTAEPDRIAKVQTLLRAYILEMTEGRLDAAYVERRLRVGDAHQRVGLDPEWYIGAFSRYLRLMLRALVRRTGDGARILPAIEALVKLVLLDMSLAIDTYIHGGYVDRAVASDLERAARVAEEALRARAEVERLKDDLTRMVVHDLKNPVNGIAMMVQLALRKAHDLPPAQRSYLGQIERTCREMTRLIQNLLEISKIEEGKMPVAEEPIVLAEVVDEVVREYAPAAQEAGRRLHVAVATDLAPARGDRALLKRTLVNLVVNALRHSGSRDVRLEGAPGPGPGEVSIRVIDHGQGIPPAEQAMVFEKFRVVRRSPTDDPSSDTGLGLPFCKLAVERMGGRIELESVPGRRTVFAVTLPTFAGEPTPLDTP
jgi:signal transduction histidine kinase